MKKSKYELIEATKNFLYEKIRVAQEQLEELRKTCDHPFESIEIIDYSWAPGHISPNTKACRICGEILPSENYILSEDSTYTFAETDYVISNTYDVNVSDIYQVNDGDIPNGDG